MWVLCMFTLIFLVIPWSSSSQHTCNIGWLVSLSILKMLDDSSLSLYLQLPRHPHIHQHMQITASFNLYSEEGIELIRDL